jgi:hypothetical protein
LIKNESSIEVCPLLVLPAGDHDAVTSTFLVNYLFDFDKEEKKVTLVLGFGSLYNHATHSNAAYQLDAENKTMTFYALEDIPAGREICINYSGEPGKEPKEWFEARNIQSIL